MRTITFSKFFNQCVAEKALDPAASGLSATQEELLCYDINNYLKKAWEFDWWPELMVCESRAVTTGADSSLYVPYAESGKTTLGHVLACWKNNPRSSDVPYRLGHVMTELGALLPTGAPTTSVYVESRKRVPEFTRTAWSGATAYVVGDIVYYSTNGECYQSIKDGTNKNPVTETTYWTKLEFPQMFAHYVRRRVKLAQQELEGDDERSVAQHAADPAEAILIQLADVECAAQAPCARVKLA